MRIFPIYILLVVLSSIVGFQAGKQVFVSQPAGKWEKIVEIYEYPFTGNDVYYLSILSVTKDSANQHLIMYFYSQPFQGGEELYQCDLDDGACLLANGSITLPLDPDINTFTHDVKLSEVPEIPLFSSYAETYIGRQYVDMVRVEIQGGEYTLYEYYALLFDGSIWKWRYFSTISTEIKRFLFALVGSVCGITISLFVIELNKRLLSK